MEITKKRSKKIRKKLLSPTYWTIMKTKMITRNLGILIMKQKSRRNKSISRKQPSQPLGSRKRKIRLIKSQKLPSMMIWMICNLGLTRREQQSPKMLPVRSKRMKSKTYHQQQYQKREPRKMTASLQIMTLEMTSEKMITKMISMMEAQIRTAISLRTLGLKMLVN